MKKRFIFVIRHNKENLTQSIGKTITTPAFDSNKFTLSKNKDNSTTKFYIFISVISAMET